MERRNNITGRSPLYSGAMHQKVGSLFHSPSRRIRETSVHAVSESARGATSREERRFPHRPRYPIIFLSLYRTSDSLLSPMAHSNHETDEGSLISLESDGIARLDLVVRSERAPRIALLSVTSSGFRSIDHDSRSGCAN